MLTYKETIYIHPSKKTFDFAEGYSQFEVEFNSAQWKFSTRPIHHFCDIVLIRVSGRLTKVIRAKIVHRSIIQKGNNMYFSFTCNKLSGPLSRDFQLAFKTPTKTFLEML